MFDYQILLKILRHYEVNGRALGLIRRNLFGRKQHIKNNNDIKYLLEIDNGLTQGSLLGPLLVLIYEKDFYIASKLRNLMFGDDKM